MSNRYNGEHVMKYAILIYQPSGYEPKSLPKDELKAIGDEYRALGELPNVEPGLPLGFIKDAVTVRVSNGEVKTAPGPYVNEAGAIGGYYIVEVETKEDAVALAARVPAARLGGAVEVRPAQIYW
jgi:hypothetical protein